MLTNFWAFPKKVALSLLAFFEKNKKELKHKACLERSRKVQSLTHIEHTKNCC